MMRDTLRGGAVVLAVVAFVLLLAGAAGVAIGLFLGAILWAIEKVAGPFSEPVDRGLLWFTLSALALVLAFDLVWGLRRSRRKATPSQGPSGATRVRVG